MKFHPGKLYRYIKQVTMQKTNAELEKMLAEKSAALNQAQRQLEIEISLERVRVVAMAMQQPDDVLGICELLFKELEKLGKR